MDKIELMKTANEVRKGIVTAVHSAKAGHPGGSFGSMFISSKYRYVKISAAESDPPGCPDLAL